MFKKIVDLRQIWTEEEISSMRESLILDAFININKNSKSKDELIDWIMDESFHPFSFNVCCMTVGFDPDIFRKEIFFDKRVFNVLLVA